MTITVHDDSGAVQETLEVSHEEARDLEVQLPEGWYIEVLGEEED